MATPRNRARTFARVSVETAEREKLNCERGIKPLPVSRNRDDSRPGQCRSGWVGETLLYSVPRNQRRQGALETMLGREPETFPKSRTPLASSQRDCCDDERE